MAIVPAVIQDAEMMARKLNGLVIVRKPVPHIPARAGGPDRWHRAAGDHRRMQFSGYLLL